MGFCFQRPGGTDTELADSLVQAKFHAVCKHPTSRTLNLDCMEMFILTRPHPSPKVILCLDFNPCISSSIQSPSRDPGSKQECLLLASHYPRFCSSLNHSPEKVKKHREAGVNTRIL